MKILFGDWYPVFGSFIKDIIVLFNIFNQLFKRNFVYEFFVKYKAYIENVIAFKSWISYINYEMSGKFMNFFYLDVLIPMLKKITTKALFYCK